ncbi:hypothetical protein HK097_005845, partial [Rhizophlyctis rosea]
MADQLPNGASHPLQAPLRSPDDIALPPTPELKRPADSPLPHTPAKLQKTSETTATPLKTPSRAILPRNNAGRPK